MTDTKTRGEELRDLRNKGGLSLWDVAKPLGLTANDLSNIERDIKAVSDEQYEQIKLEIVRITDERAMTVRAAAAGVAA